MPDTKIVDIKDVFSAAPCSTWQFLCENGQGFYVPAYQRPYSWKAENVQRLFEDSTHGLSMLVDHHDSITFIGTIIAIHDTNYKTVSPLVRPDVPSKVMTIIDGQQRLSTLLMTYVAMHEEIGKRARIFSKSKDIPGVWLFKETRKVLGRLNKMYEEDMTYGDGDFQFYPRMIRAYVDSWSRDKSKV